MIEKTNSSSNVQYGQYIVFELENEMYGLGVKKVESIERMTQITRVPDSSEYVLGIINLRGDILPVLSLRHRIGFKPKEYNSDTRIIVIDTVNFRVGIVVDRVIEILSLSEVMLQSAKEILIDRESHFFEGIYRSNGNVIMILDVDVILGIEHSDIDKEYKDAAVI